MSNTSDRDHGYLDHHLVPHLQSGEVVQDLHSTHPTQQKHALPGLYVDHADYAAPTRQHLSWIIQMIRNLLISALKGLDQVGNDGLPDVV